MFRSTRVSCANDDEDCKKAAVAHCQGCSKAFCIAHFDQHRRLMSEEMDTIVDQYEQLRTTFDLRLSQSEFHPFLMDIDKWEKESIVKVQKRADNLRKQFTQSIATHENEVRQRLQELSEKLKISRENSDLIETDLEQWKTTLNDLKTNLIPPSAMVIHRQNTFSLAQTIPVTMLKIVDELFEQASDNRVKISSDGQTVTHDQTKSHTEIRGKNSYTSGLHRIRLSIEGSTDCWILLGINYKLASLQKHSYSTKSTYGWSSSNHIWSNGQGRANTSSSPMEMKKNDIITVLFDCDDRMIIMINERTTKMHELRINLVHCPFPWQLHVNLLDPNSSLRILSQ